MLHAPAHQLQQLKNTFDNTPGLLYNNMTTLVGAKGSNNQAKIAIVKALCLLNKMNDNEAKKRWEEEDKAKQDKEEVARKEEMEGTSDENGAKWSQGCLRGQESPKCYGWYLNSG
jgi:hypothetical protein